MTPAQVRRLALAFPGATEQPHHGFASFRVGGRIFATLPDEGHLNVMVDPDEVDEALVDKPPGCAQLWWGKRLRGVHVVLAQAQEDVVDELLDAAWNHKRRPD